MKYIWLFARLIVTTGTHQPKCLKYFMFFLQRIGQEMKHEKKNIAKLSNYVEEKLYLCIENQAKKWIKPGMKSMLRDYSHE